MLAIKLALLIILSMLTPAWAGTVTTPAAGYRHAECNPRVKVCEHDEFLGGTTSAPGSQAWTNTGGTAVFLASENNAIGILQRNTGGSINTRTATYLAPSGYVLLGTATTWTQSFRHRMTVADATVTFQAGLSSSPGSSGTDQIQIQKLGADSYYSCLTVVASASTKVLTSIAATTAWTWTKLVRTPTSLEFYIDDVLACTYTANIPTAKMQPVFAVTNLEAVAKTADVDYWGLEVDVTR